MYNALIEANNARSKANSAMQSIVAGLAAYADRDILNRLYAERDNALDNAFGLSDLIPDNQRHRLIALRADIYKGYRDYARRDMGQRS